MATVNKQFGLADPQYDALRVLSTQGLDVVTGDGASSAGGGLENKIYLWPADGSTISTYDADQAGLIAALAAETSGDTVWLPSIPIALTVGITIPAGAALAAISEKSILNFSGFDGAAMTLLAGSVVHRPIVNFVATGSDATGILADAADCVVIDPVVNVSGATVTNIAIGAGVANTATEAWIGGPGFVAWTEDGGTTWDDVESLPAGSSMLDFDGLHDGSAIFVRMAVTLYGDQHIYKCENPKDGSPTWTEILAPGDTITGGVTVTESFGTAISWIRCAGSTLYCVVHGSNDVRYNGAYTLSGGWTFTATSANTISPRALLDHYSYKVDASTYAHKNLAGSNVHTWTQSEGFDDASGDAWRNLISGHWYAERGVNGTPALYYFRDLTDEVDVIGDEFDTHAGTEGYLPSAKPRGAWYGPQVYVTDPENGDLYLSDDGASFSVVETWAHGYVMDDVLIGGGNLWWARRTISNGTETVHYSIDRGANWTDATGNLWSVISIGSSQLLNLILVWA